MSTLNQTHTPFLPSLLTWVMRAFAAMKPKHNSAAVAAIVARSGNPSGV